ncbi:hypothetical protein ADUPG1_001153, partial [Aduncisulcus paluster]
PSHPPTSSTTTSSPMLSLIKHQQRYIEELKSRLDESSKDRVEHDKYKHKEDNLRRIERAERERDRYERELEVNELVSQHSTLTSLPIHQTSHLPSSQYGSVSHPSTQNRYPVNPTPLRVQPHQPMSHFQSHHGPAQVSRNPLRTGPSSSSSSVGGLRDMTQSKKPARKTVQVSSSISSSVPASSSTSHRYGSNNSSYQPSSMQQKDRHYIRSGMTSNIPSTSIDPSQNRYIEKQPPTTTSSYSYDRSHLSPPHSTRNSARDITHRSPPSSSTCPTSHSAPISSSKDSIGHSKSAPALTVSDSPRSRSRSRSRSR